MILGKVPVQLGTVRLLKNPSTLRYLPIMYKTMAAGHFRRVARHLRKAFGQSLTLPGMAVAVRAAACLSPERKKRVEQQARNTLLGNTFNIGTMVFQSTDIPELDSDFCKPVKSDVPTLVLTGTLDGRTYPAGHAAILAGLTNGSEVVIENAGHDLFMSSPKVIKDIVAFFSGNPLKYRQIQLPIPAFVTPAMMRKPSSADR